MNEELTELTNELGKIQADIKLMKIWMAGDLGFVGIGSLGETHGFTGKRVELRFMPVAGLQERRPALGARIDELSGQLNQIELELLEP